jgi:hypothetical protein
VIAEDVTISTGADDEKRGVESFFAECPHPHTPAQEGIADHQVYVYIDSYIDSYASLFL